MAIIDGGAIAQQIFDRMAMQVLMISENEHICNTDPMVAADSPWAPAALAYGQYYPYMHDTLGVGGGDAEVEADLSGVFGDIDDTNQTEAYIVSKLSAAINRLKTHVTSREYGAGAPAGLLGTTPSSFNNWLAECEVGGIDVHREFARAYAWSTGENLQARNVFIDSNTNLLVGAARTLTAWGTAGTVMSYNDMDLVNDFLRAAILTGMGRFWMDVAVQTFEFGLYLMTPNADQPGRQAYSEYDATVVDATDAFPTYRCEYAPTELWGYLDVINGGGCAAVWTLDVTTVNSDGTTQVVPLVFQLADAPGQLRQVGAGEYIGVSNIAINGGSAYAGVNLDAFHIVCAPARDIDL